MIEKGRGVHGDGGSVCVCMGGGWGGEKGGICVCTGVRWTGIVVCKHYMWCVSMYVYMYLKGKNLEMRLYMCVCVHACVRVVLVSVSTHAKNHYKSKSAFSLTPLEPSKENHKRTKERRD